MKKKEKTQLPQQLTDKLIDLALKTEQGQAILSTYLITKEISIKDLTITGSIELVQV